MSRTFLNENYGCTTAFDQVVKQGWDPVVTDIRAIKYKYGNISVKVKSFDNDFFDLPQRKRRNEVASLSEFQQSHQAPLKITHTKWNHFQNLKAVIPSDCHPFYDSLRYE